MSWRFLEHRRKHYTLAQRILLLKQLHLILASGISILKGIVLVEQRVDKEVAHVCRRLQFDLQGGKSLALAMQKNPAFFPPLVVTLTNAGEQSGELAQILQALAEYYTRQKELKSFLVKSLLYPCFLLTAALGVLCFFAIYVLPVLATAYTALQAKPGRLLLFLLQVNSLLKDWYPLVIMACLGLGYGLKQALPWFLQQLLRIQACKKIYLLVMEARFCKLLELLLNSGINITEAVMIAGSTVTEPKLLSKLQLFKDYLQRGIEISTAIEHSLGLFTPLTEELLAMGAATGYLPQMLNEAAQIAEEDLHERLAKIQELLAPTLLLVVALLTAGIVSIVMGPLFDLFTTIPEY